MVRASSVERALLFDIVVSEKGCAGGGLGLAMAGSSDLLLVRFWKRRGFGFCGSLERSGDYAGSGLFVTKAREVTGS